jgi:hypothetical protein
LHEADRTAPIAKALTGVHPTIEPTAFARRRRGHCGRPQASFVTGQIAGHDGHVDGIGER